MADRIKISQKVFEVEKTDRKWNFEIRPGGWVIATCDLGNGQILKKRICAQSIKQKLWIQLGGWSWNGEWMLNAKGSQVNAASDLDLIAQFPGKVRKILVQENQKVRSGEYLVLVEAMKMEFKIKSPYDGTVSKILVKEGQNLIPGDRFIEIIK